MSNYINGYPVHGHNPYGAPVVAPIVQQVPAVMAPATGNATITYPKWWTERNLVQPSSVEGKIQENKQDILQMLQRLGLKLSVIQGLDVTVRRALFHVYVAKGGDVGDVSHYVNTTIPKVLFGYAVTQLNQYCPGSPAGAQFNHVIQVELGYNIQECVDLWLYYSNPNVGAIIRQEIDRFGQVTLHGAYNQTHQNQQHFTTLGDIQQSPVTTGSTPMSNSRPYDLWVPSKHDMKAGEPYVDKSVNQHIGLPKNESASGMSALSRLIQLGQQTAPVAPVQTEMVVTEPTVIQTPEGVITTSSVAAKPTVVPIGWNMGDMLDPTAMSKPAENEGLPPASAYSADPSFEDLSKPVSPEVMFSKTPVSFQLADQQFLDDDDDIFDDAAPPDTIVDPAPKPVSSLDDYVAQAGSNYTPPDIKLDVPTDRNLQRVMLRENRIKRPPARLRNTEYVATLHKGRVSITLTEPKSMHFKDHVIISDAQTTDSRDIVRGISALTSATKSLEVWDLTKMRSRLIDKLSENDNLDQAIGEITATKPIVDVGVTVVDTPAIDHSSLFTQKLVDEGITEGVNELTELNVFTGLVFNTSLYSKESNADALELVNTIVTFNNATDIIESLRQFKLCSLGMREIAKQLRRFNNLVERHVKIEFNTGATVVNAIEQYSTLLHDLTLMEPGALESDIADRLDRVYMYAATDLFNVVSVDETDFGFAEREAVVLLPIHYTQYPVDYLGDLGCISKDNLPELYDFCNKIREINQPSLIRLVTLDATVISICLSPGEEETAFVIGVDR